MKWRRGDTEMGRKGDTEKGRHEEMLRKEGTPFKHHSTPGLALCGLKVPASPYPPFSASAFHPSAFS
jgi:hypothetical protein